MRMEQYHNHFSCLHPGLTALQRLEDLALFSLPRLRLDVDIVLKLYCLKRLSIVECDDLSIDGGVGMLIRNHTNLTRISVSGTRFGYRLGSNDLAAI